MHDDDNPPLTPRQEHVHRLTESVHEFVQRQPDIDLHGLRRFLWRIRTGDPEIDAEVRANAEVIVLPVLGRQAPRPDTPCN